jgi:hypothetical protein
MARQGYDLQLTQYGERGWRAASYPAGIAHSQTAAVGSSVSTVASSAWSGA